MEARHNEDSFPFPRSGNMQEGCYGAHTRRRGYRNEAVAVIRSNIDTLPHNLSFMW